MSTPKHYQENLDAIMSYSAPYKAFSWSLSEVQHFHTLAAPIVSTCLKPPSG